VPNRILKESICTSDTVAAMSWFEECLFTRLITACDDYGRFDGRLPILKAQLFPLKCEVSEPQIQSALDSLEELDCIRRYVVEDKPYLMLTSWARHQTIRAKRSKFPPPPSPAPAPEKKLSPESLFPRRGKHGHVLLTDRQMEELTRTLGKTRLDRCIETVDEIAHRTGNSQGWFNWEAVVRRCSLENWTEETVPR